MVEFAAKLKGFIKKHPYATGGIVLGVGVVLLMATRGGGSSAANSGQLTGAQEASLEEALSGQQAQLQAAELQSNEQLSADQMSAQVQESQIGGQLSQDQIAASLQTALQQLQGGTQENLADTQANEMETLGEYSLFGTLGSGLLSNLKSIGQLFTGTPATTTITQTAGSSGLFGSLGGSAGAAASSPSSFVSSLGLGGGVGAASEPSDIGALLGYGSDAGLPSAAFTAAPQIATSAADFGSIGGIGGDIGDIGDALA